MKQCAAFASCLALAVLALAAGCAEQKTILVFSEPAWREILDLDPGFRASLDQRSRELNLAVRYAEPAKGANTLEQLRSRLTATRADLVLCGPLSGGDLMLLAPQFPAVAFAVLEMPRLEGLPPPNIVPVRSDPRAAFFEAGRLSGEAIAGGRIPGLGSKVGVIATGLTGLEKEKIAEFMRGFSEHAETEQVIIEEIGSVNDRARAFLAVENLLNQDVRLFLVTAYGLTGACLERIAQADVFFMIENFGAYNLYPEKCLLSIEADYSAALAAVLKAERFLPSPPPAAAARVQPGALLR